MRYMPFNTTYCSSYYIYIAVPARRRPEDAAHPAGTQHHGARPPAATAAGHISSHR